MAHATRILIEKFTLHTYIHNYKRTLGNVKNSKNMNNIFMFQI